jgi:hypothetical protein
MRLAVLIMLSEFIGQLPHLLWGDVAVSHHFLLDVINVVNEVLEGDEFVESDLPLKADIVDTLRVLLHLIKRKTHEEALGEVFQADGLPFLILYSILMELIVPQSCL